MNEINHFYKDIFGWFDFEPVYGRFLREIPDGAKVVEIGAFLGRSTSFLAVEAHNLNKGIQIDVIDTFEGSPNENQGNNAVTEWIRENSTTTMYETFCKNLSPVIDKINIIKEDSLKAVNRYKDESIDFLFIDSDHEYNHFCKELKAYLPKIKSTGIIAGHDAYYPDIEKAIKEFFPSAYEINGFSWFHYKDHFKLRGFKNGWFIGNFDPSLLKTEAFEVAVQTHKKGFIGQKHYHSRSTEYNVVLDGKVNINGSIKEKGDIFVFLANQISESKFLEDTQILVVRTPSAPEDKVIV